MSGFGPPSRFNGTSSWPWIDHPASGLLRATIRPIQTRFRSGSTYRLNLAAQSNSLTHYAKGTRSPLELLPRATTVCRQMVSGTISLPSPGCFSPFPHGTCSLSVAKEYLALGDGPPRFPQGSTCPVVLRIRARKACPFRLRGSHPLWRAFPGASSTNRLDDFPGPP